MIAMFQIKTSKIRGQGLFATVDLLPGILVPIPSYKVTTEAKGVICMGGQMRQPYNPFRYINCSEIPNIELIYEKDNLYLRVLSVIPAGTELTFNDTL